jgi:hypothetical protein
MDEDELLALNTHTGPQRMGPSQSVPGAIDIRGANGRVVPVSPDVADRLVPMAPVAPPVQGIPVEFAAQPAAGIPQEFRVAPAVRSHSGSVARGLPAAPASMGAQSVPVPAPTAPRDITTSQSIEELQRQAMAQAMSPGGIQQPARPVAPTPAQAAEQALQPASPMQGERIDPGELVGLAPRGSQVAAQGGGMLDSPESRLQFVDALTGGALSGGRGGGGGGPRVTTTQTARQTVSNPTEAQAEALGAAGAELDGLEGEQAALMRDQGQREAEQYSAQAREIADTAERMRQIEADQAEQQQRQRQAIDRYTRAADDAVRRIESQEIDRSQVWGSNAAANRAVGALSVGVGALIQGLTGGANSALAIIDRAIETDLQEQTQNLGRATAAASDRMQLIGVAEQASRDQDGQFAVLRESKLAQLETYLRGIDMSARGPQAIAAQEQMLNELAQRRAAARQAAISAGVEQITIEQETRRRTGGGGAGRPRVSIPQAIALAEFANGPAGEGAPAAAVNIPGLRVTNADAAAATTADPTTRRRLQEMASTAAGFDAINRRALALRGQYGAEVFNSGAVAESEALQGDMIAALGRARETGVIGEGEYERLSSQIPNATDFSFSQLVPGMEDRTTASLRAIRETVNSRLSAGLRTYGYDIEPTSAVSFQAGTGSE